MIDAVAIGGFGSFEFVGVGDAKRRQGSRVRGLGAEGSREFWC
jgi:hypothetical protein